LNYFLKTFYLMDFFFKYHIIYARILNNTYINQLKISKFTKVNKQTIFSSAKQTLIMTYKFFIPLSNLFCDYFNSKKIYIN
jgi:hypothetical protein